MKWLIEQQAFGQLKDVYKMLHGGSSREDICAFLMITMPDNDSNILSVSDGVATIEINGVLRDTSSPWYGCGYPDINDAIDAVESDDSIDSVDFKINSPGGVASGLFETTDKIAAMKKPNRAIVSSLAASAGYAIASQCDEIIATNRSATFGSIGIVQTFYIYEEEVSVTSTNSENKVPDPTSANGVKEIKRHLDELHDLFVDAIVTGRSNSGLSISANDVNNDFGKGGVFLAGEAVKRGMVDKLDETMSGVVNNQESATLNKNIPASKCGKLKKEVMTMDLAKLKADYPALYRAVLDAGIQEGVSKERDRVSAHIIYGESSGAMDVATSAIKNGDEITEALRAQYITAGMNKNSLSNMIADDADAPNGKSTDSTMEEAEFTDALFAEVSDNLGIQA